MYRKSPTIALIILTLVSLPLSAQKKVALPKPSHANVKYGAHERQLLDIWLAETEKPTPVVVFIHGGGFTSGSKKQAAKGQRTALKYFLDSGVSFAAISYPLKHSAKKSVKNPVPWPDIFPAAARAIQYIRYKSKQWNIDKQRFAVYGSSAGSGLTLWAAFHDDIADPDNRDPVLRESSRPTIVGSNVGQASYDFRDWPEILKMNNEFVNPKRGAATLAEMLLLDNIKDLAKPEIKAQIKEYLDIPALISKDDPPV